MIADHDTSTPSPVAADRRDAILQAVAFAASRLLVDDPWQERVDAVLGILGAATDVDRVYVFENDDDPGSGLRASQRWEWVADGVAPQIDNPDLQDVPFQDAGMGRWADLLSCGEPVHGDIHELPASEQALLRPQGVTSLVVVPIDAAGTWWGFMGFDATDGPRRWAPSEVDALRAAAGMLGAALNQQAVLDELRSNRRSLAAAYAREQEVSERLRELDRLKDAFIDAVSHELRTPLAVASGMLETLQVRGDALDPGTRAHLVFRAAEATDRLERLLTELLDVNRLRRGAVQVRREPTDLPALLDRAVAAYPPLRSREVEVDVAFPVALVDPVLVERILSNLLTNAVTHAAAAHVLVRADGTADELHLTVADDGPGIPADDRERVFAPFERLPREGATPPGTGMGLSLVASFAAIHGGRAWITGRPGGGTAVHVTLATQPV